MEELSDIVQNFINNEKRLLIKRLCNSEVCLINKEQELIEKYVENNLDSSLNHCSKKMKLSNDVDNMDFLSNDSLEPDSLVEPIKVLNINETNNNSDDIDIEALYHKLKNMSLKDIQEMCENKSIDIYKTSKSSGKTVKKTKKDLMDILTYNP